MHAKQYRRPTVLDYLLRAGDAFTASLALLAPHATPADETRAQRLADYADRCAVLAARTAGRDPVLFERAVDARDMASRVQVVSIAIRAPRESFNGASRAA